MRDVYSLIKPLIGNLSWGVTWDCQLNLTISFGRPVLRIREPYKTKSKSKSTRESSRLRDVTVKGEYWLWIFCAYWKINIDDKYQATGASSYKNIRMASSRLDGQRLVSVSVNQENGSTEFRFDLGATLSVRRLAKDDSDIWSLYLPNKKVLSVQGNGTFTYDLGTLPSSYVVPHPLGHRLTSH